MTARADGSAPPGPPLPRWLQTLAFIVGPLRYIETCRRRYGEVVMFRSLSDPRFAMVFDPELVKQVFRSQPEELRAGEVLAAWIGPSSVHHVNGVEHRRLRRLLQPHFHGDRMRAHESTIRNAADRTIDLWPVGRPFALLPSMRSLAFEVIVRVVLGIDERARREEVKRRFRAMLDPVAPRLG